MCQTTSLESNMRTFKIMSIIDLVFGVALIIAGIVAVTYNLPDYCNRRSLERGQFDLAISKSLSMANQYSSSKYTVRQACGTSWTNGGTSFTLGQSGSGSCGSCGTDIKNIDLCRDASATGSSTLNIGGLGSAENFAGPMGCHIQEGANFQFNNNMDGYSMGGHTPVCLTGSTDKLRCEDWGYWCGNGGCDVDNCCGTPNDPSSVKDCCWDFYCTCDSSKENCDCGGNMCDGSPGGADYPNPEQTEEYFVSPSCVNDRNDANRLMQAISLWGTLPAIIPIIFGGVGILAAMKSSKCIVGVVLGFSIVGFVLSAIGFFIPMIGASIVTAVCEADDIRKTSEGVDWCDRYGGSLWAVAVLNVILAIYQLAFSIVGCCFCCAGDDVWNQANGGAPAGTAMAQPGQPVYNAAVPASAPAAAAPIDGIPMAQAVPAAPVDPPPKY